MGGYVSRFTRESLSEVIINDLGNYRQKRILGLATMFGDQRVTSEFGDPLPTLYVQCGVEPLVSGAPLVSGTPLMSGHPSISTNLYTPKIRPLLYKVIPQTQSLVYPSTSCALSLLCLMLCRSNASLQAAGCGCFCAIQRPKDLHG